MKSKRLIALLVIFMFIAAVVTLNSTVFTLKSVELNWLTTRVELKDTTSDVLLQSVNVPIGENVFFINKNKFAYECEKQNSYLQVVNIETLFPNKIVMHVAERQQVYAIKINDDLYAIADKKLKVLNVIASEQLFKVKEDIRPVVVTINGYNVVEDDLKIGELATINGAEDILTSLTISLLEARYEEQAIRGFINSVNINLNTHDITISTRYGIKILIKESNELLTEKIVMGIAAWGDQHSKHGTIGTIKVFTDINNKVQAVHTYDNF